MFGKKVHLMIFIVALLSIHLVACQNQRAELSKNSIEPRAIRQHSSKWKNLQDALHNSFQITFPQLFNKVENLTTFDINTLSEADKTFYEKYVGFYLSRKLAEYQTAKRKIYSIRKRSTNWGGTYSFGKFVNSIDYNVDLNSFYDASAGASSDIKDIKSFKLQEDLIRVNNPQNPDKFFEDLIRRKKSDSEAVQAYFTTSQPRKTETRNIVSTFFEAIENKRFEEASALCSATGVLFDEPDAKILRLEDAEFINKLQNIKQSFEYSYIPSLTWTPYINVFYSEDEQWILSRFPNSTFLELKSSSPYNYFSLILVPEHETMKIVYIRNCLDQQ